MVALRTQQIIAEESGVANTVDPLGGSYAVEALTDAIEKAAEVYIAEIDRRGGMVKAIEQGYPQLEIAEAAYRDQQRFDRGEQVIVGVNKYTVPEERPVDILRIPLELEARQIERVRRFKQGRDRDRASGRRSSASAPPPRDGREPHAAAGAGGPGRLHGRRDLGHLSRGVRRVPRPGAPVRRMRRRYDGSPPRCSLLGAPLAITPPPARADAGRSATRSFPCSRTHAGCTTKARPDRRQDAPHDHRQVGSTSSDGVTSAELHAGGEPARSAGRHGRHRHHARHCDASGVTLSIDGTAGVGGETAGRHQGEAAGPSARHRPEARLQLARRERGRDHGLRHAASSHRARAAAGSRASRA